MSEEFDFAKWCEDNGLTKKTADTLKEQDLNVSEALSLLDKSDLDDLGKENHLAMAAPPRH